VNREDHPLPSPHRIDDLARPIAQIPHADLHVRQRSSYAFSSGVVEVVDHDAYARAFALPDSNASAPSRPRGGRFLPTPRTATALPGTAQVAVVIRDPVRCEVQLSGAEVVP
jgi:hypothetical protein